MTGERPEPQMLDINQFTSREDAVAKIHRSRGFDDVAHRVFGKIIERGAGMTLLNAFFSSALTRIRGLHDAIVREIQHSNPHAVFPLMRQYAESVALVLYVADYPSYVEAVAVHPRERKSGSPARKSVRTLVDYVDKNYAEQFGLVYAELCEITHFGSTAMWSSHRVESDSEHRISWASYPRWRDERQFYIACAQVLELSTAAETALKRLGNACIREASPRPESGRD